MNQILIFIVLALVLSADAGGISRNEENDLEKRLQDLTESEDPLAVERDVCEAQYVKVGCYKDNGVGQGKVLSELLFTDRNLSDEKSSHQLIDWENYGTYLEDLACRCAQAARKKGFTHFGLQFYGECFSGPKASRVYNRDGKSKECINPDYQPCNSEDAHGCVGKAHANFIYRILEEGSGGGQVDYNAYDA